MPKKTLHPTYVRLMEAAAKAGLHKHVDIARRMAELGVSVTDQQISNWKYRGVPSGKMSKAAQAARIERAELEYGEVAKQKALPVEPSGIEPELLNKIISELSVLSPAKQRKAVALLATFVADVLDTPEPVLVKQTNAR